MLCIRQVEEKEEDPGHNAIAEMGEKEETETNIGGSEEMELHINHILDRIESFTQLVTAVPENARLLPVIAAKFSPHSVVEVLILGK